MKQVKNAEKELADKVHYLEKWRECHVKNCEITSVAEKKSCSDDFEVCLQIPLAFSVLIVSLNFASFFSVLVYAELSFVSDSI